LRNYKIGPRCDRHVGDPYMNARCSECAAAAREASGHAQNAPPSSAVTPSVSRSYCTRIHLMVDATHCELGCPETVGIAQRPAQGLGASPKSSSASEHLFVPQSGAQGLTVEDSTDAAWGTW